MKFKDIENAEEYLEKRCYCPHEIYSPDGFFYELFSPDDEVEMVAESDERKLKLIKATSQMNDSCKPQLIMIFYSNDQPNYISDMERVDATENNLKGLKGLVEDGKAFEGFKIDEFVPGSTEKSLNEVMSVADAIMVS